MTACWQALHVQDLPLARLIHALTYPVYHFNGILEKKNDKKNCKKNYNLEKNGILHISPPLIVGGASLLIIMGAGGDLLNIKGFFSSVLQVWRVMTDRWQALHVQDLPLAWLKYALTNPVQHFNRIQFKGRSKVVSFYVVSSAVQEAPFLKNAKIILPPTVMIFNPEALCLTGNDEMTMKLKYKLLALIVHFVSHTIKDLPCSIMCTQPPHTCVSGSLRA